MKITASRRDEVAKREAEYKQTYEAKKAAYDKDLANYNYAVDYNSAIVENAIRDHLSSVTRDYPLEINVRGAWGEFQVTIKRENLFNDETSLSWSWTASISDTDERVKRESSSWSGMKATTPEQAEDLVKTANVLRAIVDIDWEKLLKEALANSPDYEYFMEHENPGTYPKTFDNEYILADIYDAIDEGKFIKGDAVPTTVYRPSTQVYYKIISETPSSFKVIYFGEHVYNQSKKSGEPVTIYGPITVRKSTLLPAIAKKNVETLDDPNEGLTTL